MKPLVRHASLSVFNTISKSIAPRSTRELANRPFLQTSACLRCQFRTQIRLYTDSSKPPPTLTSSSSSTSSPSTSPPLPSSTTPPQPSKDATSPPPPPHTPHTSPAAEPDDVSELPSTTEHRRSLTSKRFSNLMDHLQGNIFIASQRLNDLTGYSGIELLKRQIGELERDVAAAQADVRATRDAYKATVAERAATQREVTTLLARKDSWSPADLERFTLLYRNDHGNEHAVQEASARLAEAERAAEQCSGRLGARILARYHEEQIWSDKIRRMSTWGTWGLMGVNVLLFLVFQLGFEPWRRKRLVKGFEDKVLEALEKEKSKLLRAGELGEGQGRADGDVALLAEIEQLEEGLDPSHKAHVQASELGGSESKVTVSKDSESKTTKPTEDDHGRGPVSLEEHVPTAIVRLRRPESVTSVLQDLFSDKIIMIRKQDMTVIALEGAAVGAAITGIVAGILLKKS